MDPSERKFFTGYILADIQGAYPHTYTYTVPDHYEFALSKIEFTVISHWQIRVKLRILLLIFAMLLEKV